MSKVLDNLERLRGLLKLEPLDAASLSKRLGISQPSVSRLLAQAGADVVRIGAARSTRYALTRNIPSLPNELPIFIIAEDGSSAAFGQLRLLQSDWYLFTPANGATPQLILGLPFWLQDLRPQGFLGRLIPAMHADLPLPPSISAWSDDDTLYFLARRGEDVIGNLLVGSETYRRFLSNTPIEAISHIYRASQYHVRALSANQGDAPGSSAGGEQAKFTCLIERPDGRKEHVIVKYCPPCNSPAGQRWADLLHAEHLALQTLQQFGIATSNTSIVYCTQRVYLESIRFDRQHEHGRLAVVSMAGVDTLLGAMDQNWSDASSLLHDHGWLSSEDWQRICLLDVFGALIGNSDRHPGNLSLYWQLGRKTEPQFSLAPVYDMLPMFYRPNNQGEIIEREFSLKVLDRLRLTQLPLAWEMALVFWQAVLDESHISANFKAIATAHQAVLQNLRLS